MDQLDHRGPESVMRNDIIDCAKAQRLPGVDLNSCGEHVDCSSDSYATGQEIHRPHVRHQADRAERWNEPRMCGRDYDVRCQGQRPTTACRDAVDGRNEWLVE